MSRSVPIVALLAVLTLVAGITGCGGDRENPTPTTESDRLMESYLAKVQKIGQTLAGVSNETQARLANNQVMLLVQDMRDLVPKMQAISEKEQADTMSKYRVKINKVNEQFTKDMAQFASIPGASEELIEQLKSMPHFGEP